MHVGRLYMYYLDIDVVSLSSRTAQLSERYKLEHMRLYYSSLR